MAATTWDEVRTELSAPFGNADIEWRAQNFRGPKKAEKGAKFDNGDCLVLPYVTNRAIMERLDEVAGPGHWRNEYQRWGAKGVLCGLSVRLSNPAASEQQWVTKWDGADETDIEATKGGLSSAMKRAAVQWGMGRHLYSLPEVWHPAWVICVDTDQYGRAKYRGKLNEPGPVLPGSERISPEHEQVNAPLRDEQHNPQKGDAWLDEELGFTKQFREVTWREMCKGSMDGGRHKALLWMIDNYDSSDARRKRAESCIALMEEAIGDEPPWLTDEELYSGDTQPMSFEPHAETTIGPG